MYKYFCDRVEKGVIDYPPPLSPGGGLTVDKIYAQYTASGYTFVEPLRDWNGDLVRLAFTTSLCANCTLRGSQNKPDFWVDQE